MPSGFSAPIVHSERGYTAPYGYRSRTGMVPSSEWNVFMDDFNSFVVATAITNGPVANTPWGWQGAIIDAGATVVVDTTAVTGAHGTLSIVDADASEGAAVYGTKSLQLTSGKKFWMECRMRASDVTDSTLMFGLSSLTATTNPEDLWTTTADDFVTCGIFDGTFSRDISLLTSKTNQTNTRIYSDTTIEMAASTWHTLAWYFDGGNNIHAYIDGKLAVTWTQTVGAETIPTGVAMAPFFGALNGNSSGAATILFDYVRWVSQR